MKKIKVNTSKPYDKKRESDSINYIVCSEVGRTEMRKTAVSEFARLMEEV